jgi:hypothetical protein
MMAEKSRSIPILNKPKNLDGSMAGDEGFDPLGLSNIGDLGFDLYWMREAEIKHSRVAMLAFLGMVWTEGLGQIVPGFVSFHAFVVCSALPDAVYRFERPDHLLAASSATQPSAIYQLCLTYFRLLPFILTGFVYD